jgi:hypothetical protein
MKLLTSLTTTRVCKENTTVGRGWSDVGVPGKDRRKGGELTQERGPAPINTEKASRFGTMNICVMLLPAADMTSFILARRTLFQIAISSKIG